MRDTFRRLMPPLNIVMLTALSTLMIFLAIEVRFFWLQARELIKLKEEYANYLLGFKRMIADHHQESRELQEDGLSEDQKKKVKTTSTSS